MKLLTKATDYAIRTIIYLTKAKTNFVSARQLAHKEEIPVAYLKRILGLLTKEGVIVAKEGVKGGVRLKAHPNSIKILDILNLFQGDIQFSGCFLKGEKCKRQKECALSEELQNVKKIIVKKLEKITISGLLKKKK